MKVKCRLAFILICFGLGCNNDPLSKVCVDPIGTQNISVNSNQLFCFTKYSADCTYNGCYYMTPSLPQVIKNYAYQPSCTVGLIADVGLVSCLGQVILNPDAAFVDTVTPILHHGYLIKFPDNTYGRFFIDSWDQTSGTITKFRISRQYPF